MLGARSGLATRLKELYPTLISVHCICHKLALTCADTSKDLDYIAGVERDLRTLWKAMENSPKRTNMSLSVQEELKSLRLQDQSRPEDRGKEAEESLSYKMAVHGSGSGHCLPRP